MILSRINDPVGGVRYEGTFARKHGRNVKSGSTKIVRPDGEAPRSDAEAIECAAQNEAAEGLAFYPIGADLAGIAQIGVFAESAPVIGEPIPAATFTAKGGKEVRS